MKVFSADILHCRLYFYAQEHYYLQVEPFPECYKSRNILELNFEWRISVTSFCMVGPSELFQNTFHSSLCQGSGKQSKRIWII